MLKKLSVMLLREIPENFRHTPDKISKTKSGDATKRSPERFSISILEGICVVKFLHAGGVFVEIPELLEGVSVFGSFRR